MTLLPWCATPQPAPRQTCPECGRAVRVFDNGDVLRHNRAPTPDPIKADGPYLDLCPHLGPPVEPSVLDDIEGIGTRGFLPLAVREALFARERVGIAKYGTRLRAHSGRAPLVDLAQELLDGTVYAWQAAMESPGFGRVGWRVVSVGLGWLALVVGWLA